MNIDYAIVFERILKYLIEGISVGLICYLVAKLNFDQIIIIGVSSAAIFAILDMYSPVISNGVRVGTGITVASHFIGFKTI